MSKRSYLSQIILMPEAVLEKVAKFVDKCIKKFNGIK